MPSKKYMRLVVTGTEGEYFLTASISSFMKEMYWSERNRLQSRFWPWTRYSPMGEGDWIWLQEVYVWDQNAVFQASFRLSRFPYLSLSQDLKFSWHRGQWHSPPSSLEMCHMTTAGWEP